MIKEQILLTLTSKYNQNLMTFYISTATTLVQATISLG